VFSSVCRIARPEYFERALRLNGEMLHGGVSIAQTVDGPMFRISDTDPRTTVDAEELRRSAHEIAVRADAFGQWLSTEDRYQRDEFGRRAPCRIRRRTSLWQIRRNSGNRFPPRGVEPLDACDIGCNQAAASTRRWVVNPGRGASHDRR
jgi:hypothetical protein